MARKVNSNQYEAAVATLASNGIKAVYGFDATAKAHKVSLEGSGSLKDLRTAARQAGFPARFSVVSFGNGKLDMVCVLPQILKAPAPVAIVTEAPAPVAIVTEAPAAAPVAVVVEDELPGLPPMADEPGAVAPAPAPKKKAPKKAAPKKKKKKATKKVAVLA